MILRTVLALLPFQLIGAVALGVGIVRVQGLLRLRRRGVAVRARRLPDDAGPVPPGSAGVWPAIYRRVARFECPMLGQTRTIAESVASSSRTAWMEGEYISVIVSRDPPHAAVVATFRNLLLFPLVYLAVGVMLTIVLPVAVLLKR